MNTNTVTETTFLEKYNKYGFAELLSKLTTNSEELQKCQNETILLRAELKKEKLENSKLEQELKESSGELDNLYNEVQAYNNEVESYEKKFKSDEFCIQNKPVQKESGQIVVDAEMIIQD